MVKLEDLETIDLSEYPQEFTEELLEELGYETDGEFIFKDGNLVKDRYTDKPVRVGEMAILPGKGEGEIIIVEDCVFSFIHYFTEFEDEED